MELVIDENGMIAERINEMGDTRPLPARKILAMLAAAPAPAQEPVAEVTYSNWNGMGVTPLRGKVLPVGTKLYPGPLAVAEELPTTYRACDKNGDWREFKEIRPAAARVLEMLESEGYGSTEPTDALRSALECSECPSGDCDDCPRKPARWVPQS